jgi:beta-lactamase class C
LLQGQTVVGRFTVNADGLAYTFLVGPNAPGAPVALTFNGVGIVINAGSATITQPGSCHCDVQWGQHCRLCHNAWRTDSLPGREHLYTHAGYVLLQLALERRFGVPIDELLDERMLRPLGMRSTTLPRRDDSPRGRLSLEHQPRAVQGYGDDSAPIGEPGDQQGYYHWPATSQMYSSPRDMAVLLAANLGELPLEPSLRAAMSLAQQGVLAIGPRNAQALAWEVISDDEAIVEKYGGLNNASAYIGMIPRRKLGIVILGNRGNQYPNEVGRRMLLELAGP